MVCAGNMSKPALPFLTPMLRPDAVHCFLSRQHNEATVSEPG
jgi:hypothetical protein